MASALQTALEAGDLDGIRRCPKADLHVHAVLGGCRQFLRARTGRDVAPLGGVLRSMDEMHAWVRANVGDLFDDAAGRALAFEACFAQALRDGVTRIEMGEDVWGITLHAGSAASVWNDLKSAHERIAPEVEWIPQLGLSRHCPIPALERWIEPFLELGLFKTLDLYGDEFAQPIEAFVPIYRRARAAGLTLKAHVGEWGTDDDVWRAVEVLELDEVQHGNAAAQSPKVMAALAGAGVRLNLCPTSNVRLGRVERIEDHPIRRLFDAGVRVTINTDDPLVFGSDLSEEYLTLFQAGVMTSAELDEVRQEGLR
jgi:adenosine deaminase